MPLILALVNVALFKHFAKNHLHGFDVPFICGARINVITNAKLVPKGFEFSTDFISILFWRVAAGFGGLFDFLSVFVRAC